MRPVLPWLLVILGAVYVTVDLVQGADTSEADVERARSDSLAEVVSGMASKLTADSLTREAERAAYDSARAAWDEQRPRLIERANRASQQAARIATDLRATMNAEQQAMLDALEVEHSNEVVAITAERDTWKAEAELLTERVAADSVLIDALWRRIDVSDEGWAASRAEADLLREALADARPSAVHKAADAVAYGAHAFNLARAGIQALTGG